MSDIFQISCASNFYHDGCSYHCISSTKFIKYDRFLKLRKSVIFNAYLIILFIVSNDNLHFSNLYSHTKRHRLNIFLSKCKRKKNRKQIIYQVYYQRWVNFLNKYSRNCFPISIYKFLTFSFHGRRYPCAYFIKTFFHFFLKFLYSYESCVNTHTFIKFDI